MISQEQGINDIFSGAMSRGLLKGKKSALNYFMQYN